MSDLTREEIDFEYIKKVRNCVPFVNGSGNQEGVRETQEVIDKLLSAASERDALLASVKQLEKSLAAVRSKLAEIVCTEGCDAGVVMLSNDGPTHSETHGGRTIQVYDHEYFSPLGDALVEAWKMAGGTIQDQTDDGVKMHGYTDEGKGGVD